MTVVKINHGENVVLNAWIVYLDVKSVKVTLNIQIKLVMWVYIVMIEMFIKPVWCVM